MKKSEIKKLLIKVFIHLRHIGFSLGMSELLAALHATIGDKKINNNQELLHIVKLIWCKTIDESHVFEELWMDYLKEFTQKPLVKEESNYTKSDKTDKNSAEGYNRNNFDLPGMRPTRPKDFAEFKPLPIRTPFIPEITDTDKPDLETYFPISKSFMVYSWRYLRRLIPDGPPDVLDIKETVESTSRQGFFLRPSYRRREQNHAHLIMFLDQGGSMVPFHRFTRDLVETAKQESTIEKASAFYFQNVPAEYLYNDQNKTSKVHKDEIFAQCTDDTSILMISDAGAARGYRNEQRIKATIKFLRELKRFTPLIAWLNPMPEERWTNSSAQIIANLIPMFQMDPDGFSNAIDVIRGLPLYH